MKKQLDTKMIHEIAEKIRNYADKNWQEINDLIENMIDIYNDFTLYATYDLTTDKVRFDLCESNTNNWPRKDVVKIGIFSTKALDIRDMFDDEYCDEAIFDEVKLFYDCSMDALERNLQLLISECV